MKKIAGGAGRITGPRMSFEVEYWEGHEWRLCSGSAIQGVCEKEEEIFKNSLIFRSTVVPLAHQ